METIGLFSGVLLFSALCLLPEEGAYKNGYPLSKLLCIYQVVDDIKAISLLIESALAVHLNISSFVLNVW